MRVKDLKDCAEFISGDSAVLRELFNPSKEDLALRYSLAWAKVLPGRTTRLHRLRTSEVYYILEGRGEMHIDEEKRTVGPGQAVYIPPRSRQRIKNTDRSSLIFLCIVDPAWRPEDEEIIDADPQS
jgi:mannose-6-phosphate isomerase-like protein (cupin superfamily)